jgi:hypothetical protein
MSTNIEQLAGVADGMHTFLVKRADEGAFRKRGVTPGAMQTQNIAMGDKSMRATDMPKNAPILSGTPSTKRRSANTTELRGSSCLTANSPGSGLTPSSPPIRNGANGTMRNNARGTTMIRRSGQGD